MNKFWQKYFLMNEAGGDGADGGSATPPATPANPTAGESGAENTPPPAPNFDTGLFNDNPDVGANGEKKPDVDPENKPDESGEKYDPEQAYSEFKYELPEGYTLTDDQQKQYIDMAKEKGIKPDQLQTFVNEHIQAEQGKIEQYRGIVKDWEAEVMADPVVGGDNFPATRKNVNAACSIEGGKEFREVLSSTGLISNPAVVKYLNKLGTMVNSDGLVLGGQVKNGTNQEIKSLYDKSNY